MMMLRRSTAGILRRASSGGAANGFGKSVRGLAPAVSRERNNGYRIIEEVVSQYSSISSLRGILEGISRQEGPRFSALGNSFRRTLATSSSSQSSRKTAAEDTTKDITTSEDPFDAPTYNIPEKPVTFTEGASYSIIILLGLAAAAAAAYAVFKELIFEPKEYKIYGKALERIQNDSQVRVRIGSPVTGYGQESRNRAARQRIAHKVWTDEDGVEHIEVNFYVRGPHGAGRVYSEMFKDKVDREWKFTYLIVDILSPSQTRLMLESYVPALPTTQ